MEGPLCFRLPQWLKQDKNCIRLQVAEDIHPRFDERVISVYKDAHRPGHGHKPGKLQREGHLLIMHEIH